MSVVLNADTNANYEPSEAEIIEYGKWLGMKLPEDNAFLWIAREGLKAPLPDHWKACQSDKGELYYFNFKTGQSIWDHPMDEHFKDLFKREKENPTPQSIAQGAKRLGEQEVPSKPKKHHQKENSPSSEESEKKQTKDTGFPTTKAHPLKSLKIKKEMPAEMRLDFDEGQEKNKVVVQNQSPEFQSTTSQSDSDSSEKRKRNTTLQPRKEGIVAGGGVNGLKALSKLNSPGKIKPESPAFVDVDKKELDKVKQQHQVELDLYKQEKATELQKQKQIIDEEHETALNDLRQSLSEERKSQTKSMREDLEEEMLEEKRKMEKEMSGKLEHLKKELATKRNTELRRMKDNWKDLLDQEKKKVDKEGAEALEDYKEEARKLSESQKEASLVFLKNSETDLTVDLKQSTATLLKAFEESCNSLLRAMESSQSDFSMKSVRQTEETQSELNKRLSTIQSDHKALIDKEIKNHEDAIRELKAQHDEQKSHLESTLREELDTVSKTWKEKIDKAKLQEEQDAFSVVIEKLRSNQTQELESLKRDIREKAEGELKAVLDDVANEQRAKFENFGNNATADKEASITNTKGNINVKPLTLDDDLLAQPRSETDCKSPSFDQAKDIKSAITEALREVFAQSPFILPSPAHAIGRTDSNNTPPATVSPSEKKTTQTSKNMFAFPVSFQDQHDMVQAERKRLQEGRAFVESQRHSLEERRRQLKRTRHQWKQDVMTAKQDGVRSSSRKGQLLNKVRVALEEQAKGLQHDEDILRDSEMWLMTKEQRLVQLEEQIEEQERLRGLNDNSAINCSVDTAAVMTSFFNPQLRFAEFGAPRKTPTPPPGYTPFESPATTPVLSKALTRIEKRLDEVTSIMNMQKSQQAISSVSVGGTPQKYHLNSPGAAHSSRHRGTTSRSHSRAEIKKAATQHVDPW